MDSKNSLWVWVALIAVAIIAIGGYFVKSSGSTTLQGMTNYDGVTIVPVESTDGLKVGSNGSTFAELKATTCNLIGTNASQAASTTLPYDCAVTGIASGDVVMAQLATSTSRGAVYSWRIVGAKASTTADYITVLLNNDGPAAIPSVSSVGSSTNIWYGDI